MGDTAKELYIIGAGGFGREVADTVREINRAAMPRREADLLMDGPVYRVAGFVDDDASKWGGMINGIEVRGGVDWLRALGGDDNESCAIIAIANPQIKENILKKLDGYVNWVNIIHPLSFFMSTATIGIGNIVQQFASVNANAILGDHCLINSHTVVGHDSVLEDCVSIMHSSGIMGFCKLKKRSYIGAGAVMIQHVVIGEDAIVGAGAVVVRDVPPGATVVGNPAKQIKHSE